MYAHVGQGGGPEPYTCDADTSIFSGINLDRPSCYPSVSNVARFISANTVHSRTASSVGSEDAAALSTSRAGSTQKASTRSHSHPPPGVRGQKGCKLSPLHNAMGYLHNFCVSSSHLLSSPLFSLSLLGVPQIRGQIAGGIVRRLEPFVPPSARVESRLHIPGIEYIYM